MKVLCVACRHASLPEEKVKLEARPSAVQAAGREQTKNATLAGLSTDKANGEETAYEVRNEGLRQRRDLAGQTGAVIETEDCSCPATAASKSAQGGKTELTRTTDTCGLCAEFRKQRGERRDS